MLNYQCLNIKEAKMLKVYKEQVLNKFSTHIDLRHYNQEEDILIGDLVIVNENSKEILASDRYYPTSDFNLTQEELEILK